jgi:hypothetical protein
MKTTKTKRKLNVRLLRRIKKHILEEPRRFWMGWWVVPNVPGQHPAPCGTTACIAGWAAILGKRREPNYHNGRRALRLNERQANSLFFSHNWPEPFSTMQPLISPKPESEFQRVKRIMEMETEIESPAPWTESEFQAYAGQEPLPPNQGLQLSAEEQPTEENQNQLHLNYL